MDTSGCFFLFAVIFAIATGAFFFLETESNDREQILKKITSPYPNLKVAYYDHNTYPSALGSLNGVDLRCYFSFKGSPSNTAIYVELGKKGDFDSERGFRITKKRYPILDNFVGQTTSLSYPEADKIYHLKDKQGDFAKAIFNPAICKELVALEKSMGEFILEDGLLKCVQIPIPNSSNPPSIENIQKLLLLATKVYQKALAAQRDTAAHSNTKKKLHGIKNIPSSFLKNWS